MVVKPHQIPREDHVWVDRGREIPAARIHNSTAVCKNPNPPHRNRNSEVRATAIISHATGIPAQSQIARSGGRRPERRGGGGGYHHAGGEEFRGGGQGKSREEGVLGMRGGGGRIGAGGRDGVGLAPRSVQQQQQMMGKKEAAFTRVRGCPDGSPFSSSVWEREDAN